MQYINYVNIVGTSYQNGLEELRGLEAETYVARKEFFLAVPTKKEFGIHRVGDLQLSCFWKLKVPKFPSSLRAESKEEASQLGWMAKLEVR